MKKDIMSYCSDEILDRADKTWKKAGRSGDIKRFTVIAAAALLAVATIASVFTALKLRSDDPLPYNDTSSVSDTGKGETADTKSDPDDSSRQEKNRDFRITETGGTVGNGSAYVKESPDSASSEIPCPPQAEFHCGGIIVKAIMTDWYPGTFQIPGERQNYCLILFDVLEVIKGINVPEKIIYLMPEEYYVDLGVYDFLYLSLFQTGFNGFLLRDVISGKLCTVDAPVFTTTEWDAALGDIIAFSNGKFDESLWQTKSWLYGYQFLRHQLDTEDKELVVKRGCDENYLKAKINEKIKERSYYSEPVVFYPSDASGEVKAALEYVKNGTFVCKKDHGNYIYCKRYINNCPTNESILIDLRENTVVKSYGYKFEPGETEGLYDIGSKINALEKAYKENEPKPPHFDPEDKELASLYLNGYYYKNGNGVYAFIHTVWIYAEQEEYSLFQYYDESFTLYENGKPVDVTADELSKLLGESVGIGYPYGERVEMTIE